MKNNFTLTLICFLLITGRSYSQYCMLPGETPYSSLQPGITNFKLNTINRNSSNSESASSVVVTTGLSTTLTAGQTYTISISHSEDSQFFPGARNNLRVWVDYNNNFSYTDPGETVLSVDLQAPASTYTATFIIPSTIPAGTLSLRATAKMSSDAGHTLPTPCDVPADPLGYHGEMEDYSLVIQASGSGQSPSSNFLLTSTVCLLSSASATNNSTGTPAPTYSWTSTPSAGVTFSPNNTSPNPAISFSNNGNYTITCKATNSLSSSSSSKVITVSACGVGLTEEKFNEPLMIGPNPVTDFLNILIPSGKGNPAIHVVNCLGEVILKVDGNPGKTAKIDLSALENGVYFVKIGSDKDDLIKKIVISK
jgi:hypothetical protein